MPSDTPAFQALHEAIAAIPLIDTHEHIKPEATLAGRTWSLFDFLEHYVSSDLVSAGMSREALEKLRQPDNGLSLEERWNLMAPYWPFAKTTGYGRAMTAYMRDLFGIDDINETTWAELSRRINDARSRPGWYRTVLKDKANIDCSLVITWPGEPVAVDRAFFRAVPILDHYAIPGTRAELEQLEKEAACSIQTLDQLLTAQETMLDAFTRQGIAAVKIFLAYRRTLRFDRVSKTEAARVFDRIWLSQTQDLAFDDLKPLQDFMTRTLIGRAAERGLPIQIHTGLQEGNGNYLANSNPTLLTNVIMEFSDARFDLFHAGYPFTGELAAMAKYFPNVSADLCWVQAISPHVFKRTLHEWLDTIPANKIFAGGGDSNYVEGAHGHCTLARRLVAEVLAERVEQGAMDRAGALWYAGRILRENAREFFPL
ncbi:MAG: amidohydrolase family protein [Candidatus Hydrogenedentes bacterium]|nr:amidohydrolase family protein [Candidatus Hydrogenedentota bacterium]HOH33875.1 amidohydrolase family protein [Candidatus Hydrogenedentota bacterium]HQK76685.1 amidohydrolase family protein [Candidatus Hydrogenedentota bacterium]